MTVSREPVAIDQTPRGVVESAGQTWLGRPRWRVYVVQGLGQYGPNGHGWTVRGSREKAEAKARKELRRYEQRFAAPTERWEVR